MMSGFTTMDQTHQETNDDGVLTQVNTEDHGDNIQRQSAATEDKRRDYRKKERVFDFKERNSKLKAHPILTNSPSADLQQSSKHKTSRAGSSVDVGTKRGSSDEAFGVNIKKKLSVQTTRHLHNVGGHKHEFFFSHGNFI